jgi:hypothetical protein
MIKVGFIGLLTTRVDLQDAGYDADIIRVLYGNLSMKFPLFYGKILQKWWLDKILF